MGSQDSQQSALARRGIVGLLRLCQRPLPKPGPQQPPPKTTIPSRTLGWSCGAQTSQLRPGNKVCEHNFRLERFFVKCSVLWPCLVDFALRLYNRPISFVKTCFCWASHGKQKTKTYTNWWEQSSGQSFILKNAIKCKYYLERGLYILYWYFYSEFLCCMALFTSSFF